MISGSGGEPDAPPPPKQGKKHFSSKCDRQWRQHYFSLNKKGMAACAQPLYTATVSHYLFCH